MAIKHIAIGGISTECSSYSPLYQSSDDFKTIHGQALLDLVDYPFNEFNIKAHPLFFKKSVPGGPIEKKYFKKVKEEFIDEIVSLDRLDGILLLMHGAMYVEGIEDPEGEWIASVRNTVGNECIISVSYDLHGQMTDKIISNIDAFAAFKTAPHIDVKDTYRRSASMLKNAINENIRPQVVWSPIPVLVSGEMSSTFVEPCKSIYKDLDLYNQQKDIIDCNLMVGYVWADTSRATAASVVTCNNQLSGSKVCQLIAKSYWNKRHLLESDMLTGSIKDALSWINEDFSIIADSGDNPTAGGVGDRADILEAILKLNISGTLFAGIASKSAYKSLKDSKEFILGGAYGGGGPLLKLKADHVYFKNQCAVVSLSDSVIIITKLRRPFHNLKDFTDLDLDLNDFKTLVVKSGYLSPDLQSLSAPTFMALTSGAVNQDLMGIKNNNRLQNIYPFQDSKDYSPVVGNGEHSVNQ
ncbi:M81 family metallopeptidase [Candidatus Pseudothioglobus singularis]|nr:M81 family metallopeptidase [Candidatus Pseudothioglobus singularis]MDB4847930.1 M81 family metallopeptidase [Candidatus Pseudothioglobus singularis]